MKKILLFAMLAVLTACSTQAPATVAPAASAPPTASPVPPTATAVPPTAAPTATLVPTPTPMPDFELPTYFRDCWYQRASIGQPVYIDTYAIGKSVKQVEDWINSTKADVKITIDKNDPIVVNDPSLWTQPVSVGTASNPYYKSDFRWKMPDLPEGKYLIVIANTSPMSDYEGANCATLFMTQPAGAYQTNQLVVKINTALYMEPVTGCYDYTVAEADQPLTLIDGGQGDSFDYHITGYIKASVEKIRIDGGDPIVVTGKDGWGKIYFQDITYDYGSYWSWTLPVLSKGNHHIEVEWGVSYKVGTDSPSHPMTPDKPVQTGCVDVTVK